MASRGEEELMDEKLIRSYLLRMNNFAGLLKLHKTDAHYVQIVADTILGETEALINGNVPVSWKVSEDKSNSEDHDTR